MLQYQYLILGKRNVWESSKYYLYIADFLSLAAAYVYLWMWLVSMT